LKTRALPAGKRVPATIDDAAGAAACVTAEPAPASSKPRVRACVGHECPANTGARTTIGAQRLGQKRVVREVYADLFEDIRRCRSEGAKLQWLPVRFQYLVDDDIDHVSGGRLAADCIASLTEGELIALHKRPRGIEGGSIIDPIVR
jgi:hypothetical protein